MSEFNKLKSQKELVCRTYFVFLFVNFFLLVIAQENGDRENKVCGTVSTAEGATVNLKEALTVTPEEFESVHLGKLKNAVFSPVSGCVIKVCGYTRTDKPFYNWNNILTLNFEDCKIIQYGNETDISNIFNDRFNTTSISCGCAKQVENCELNCHQKNDKKINWQENECAILYEENNCKSCWFNPISISQDNKFQTDHSHFIRSIIIRDKCSVDESRDEEFNRGSTYFPPIKNYLESALKFEYVNYRCKCPEWSSTTITAPSTTLSTTVLPPTSTTTTATTTPSTLKTSTHSTLPEPGWCGFINPRMSSAIFLYENKIVDRNDLAKIQFGGKVERAVFASIENCTMEICGYSSTADDLYKSATCEWYKDDNVITASEKIYDRAYEVTSMSCACRPESDANFYCSPDTVDYCPSVNDKHIWNGLECAVMFQERNCQSCYFKPISLLYGTEFQSLNSFQMKSMIVRPGCFVEKHTNGYLFTDAEWTLTLEGLVNKTDPAYHKDSENFTCNCGPEVIGEMIGTTPHTTTSFEEETSTPDTDIPSSTEGTTTPENQFTETLLPETTQQHHEDVDEKHGVLSAVQYVIIFGGLGFGTVVVVAVIVILLKRHKKRRQSSNPSEITVKSYLESELGDKDTNSGNYFHELTFPGVSKSEESQKLHLVSTGQVEYQNLAVNTLSDVSSDQSDDATDKNENKNQFKAEIMEEVKKFMESFLVGCPNNDEVSSFITLQTQLAATDAGPPNFNLMSEQFNQICEPSNVVSREAFMIPKKMLENPLGVGQFGIVYKAVLRIEPDGLNELVALKKIKWTGSRSFFREIKSFQTIGNGNEYIVKFMGACCHTDGLFLLTEFCEGGSLRDHVLEKMRPQVFKQSVPLPEINVNLGDDYYGTNNDLEQRWMEEIQPVLSSSDLHQLLYWSEQIANGMEFLSANRTIHDDLALRNIVLTKDLKVKICDFGLSRKCLNTEDCARSLMTGDFPFNSFAPEFVNEAVNEPKQMSLYVDVWAYGCTLYELFTLGDSLYQDVKESGLMKFVTVRKLLMEGYRHPKPLLAPDNVYHKMMSCWNEVPKNRPSFTELRSFFETEKAKLTDYTEC